MKLPLFALAAFALAPLAHAETLICHGYEVASEPKITVKGTLKLENGKPTDATILFENFGKEGWAYFFDWKAVSKDGSRFASWFDFESKGNNMMIPGAYAGVSPEITESYVLYQAIVDGTPFDGIPKRTFIVYGADKKPLAETFCYESEPKPKAQNP